MKRITIQGIKEHRWFMEDLPTYLFPLPGERDATQIDSTVLAEVCQKLSVSAVEVGASHLPSFSFTPFPPSSLPPSFYFPLFIPYLLPPFLFPTSLHFPLFISLPPPSLPQVLAAVRGDDPHDQLAIAYQLVWDNRVLQKVLSIQLAHLDVAAHPGSDGKSLIPAPSVTSIRC